MAYIASDSVYGYPEDVLLWCKKLKVNTIRITTREEAYIDDVDAYMAKYVDPIISACKLYGIYAFIDAHNYFHEFLPSDDWLPRGPVWKKERVQKWADNWKKIADRYKDEPWVLGYELMNEPYDMDWNVTRDYYMQAIRAIREVDKKHIMLLGTCHFTHASVMEKTWGKVKFRPDEPYNQAVFAFHEYARADDPSDVAPVIDGILKKYNVPVYCTEFGAAETVSGLTLEDKRRFEQDMFAMFKTRQIGWTIWNMIGTCPDIKLDYADIWQPALAEQASPSQVQIKGVIDCSASVKSGIADNKTPIELTAIIKGLDGNPMPATSDNVRFLLKGEGVLEGENPAPVVNGTAKIKLKMNKKNVLDVLATGPGLYHGKVQVTGKPDKAVKLACKAEPPVILADGKSILTAYIMDAYGNLVDQDSNYRVNCGGPEYIDSEGRLWLGDQPYSEGSWGYTKEVRVTIANKDYKIANTKEPVLFYSGRQVFADSGYRFTLPNGNYRVELFFAETWFGVQRTQSKGARVFDIVIEGETKITNLDICDKVGPLAAFSEACLVEVKDGVLDVISKNTVNICEIRAISITPETISGEQFTFGISGPGKIEGINTVLPVGGKAVIKLISGPAAGTATVTASFPGLTPGQTEVVFTGK
ncbi:MAG: hypothetical protein A2297_05085 [Elusimicrobia bacterium RIFOXYB2_FULL_48_7]|nr:MAG: hypothetical protein A2297_05085 [Elusimicrobia bacterium RIFOXYB2_FULL_48_7]